MSKEIKWDETNWVHLHDALESIQREPAPDPLDYLGNAFEYPQARWDAVKALPPPKPEPRKSAHREDPESVFWMGTHWSLLAVPNYREWYRERYLKTIHWTTLREAKKSTVQYRCESCGNNAELQVHHVSYERTPFGELMSDLKVLCKTCHNRGHGFK